MDEVNNWPRARYSPSSTPCLHILRLPFHSLHTSGTVAAFAAGAAAVRVFCSRSGLKFSADDLLHFSPPQADQAAFAADVAVAAGAAGTDVAARVAIMARAAASST